MSERYNLERFVAAQADVFEAVCEELRAGQKTSHWMWFVFPQIAGLGSSEMARFYAIGSIKEARAYLAHPVLGERLRMCTELALGVEGRSTREIFGSPDDLKFRSSMTLFARASGGEEVFERALARYFEGKTDGRTVELLGE